MPCCQGAKKSVWTNMLPNCMVFTWFKVTRAVPGRSRNRWAGLVATGERLIITTPWPGQTTSSSGNTSSYSPPLWARCPTCSSSRLCPQLWCLGLRMTMAEWLPEDSWKNSIRIWRKTNAERQALRRCCGGLVDRKVHSKKFTASTWKHSKWHGGHMSHMQKEKKI